MAARISGACFSPKEGSVVSSKVWRMAIYTRAPGEKKLKLPQYPLAVLISAEPSLA